ncbi:phenylacetate--CoA ligase family protein [Chloroflexota bacterium]
MTDINVQQACRRLGYRAWYSLTGRIKFVNELERSQWLPSGELEELQLKKLKKLLEHTYYHIQYYRSTLEAIGYKPGDEVTLEQFRKLPVLTKRDIQDNLVHLRDTKVKSKPNHTGGSTGFPLTFYQDRNYWNHNFGDKIRTYRMCSYEVGDRVVFLWGSDYDSRQHKGVLPRLFDRLFRNMIWINTFDITEQTLYQKTLEIAKFKPKIIIGYTSSLFMLANLVREKGIAGIRPQGIQSSAEILTADIRETIESTFNCKVFDRYGCREMGNVAHECSEHSGLHILAENNLVEFLSDTGETVEAGEQGNIVVTNLNNYAMPLIRYQVDDIGVPTDNRCLCGRGLPLMEVVKGRSSDAIQSPSGKVLHGEFFTHLFYNIEGVRQFQVVQETIELLRIRIVPAGNFSTESLDYLRDVIHKHADESFTIEFDICQEIETSSSGKYRFTISNIPHRLANN